MEEQLDSRLTKADSQYALEHFVEIGTALAAVIKGAEQLEKMAEWGNDPDTPMHIKVAGDAATEATEAINEVRAHYAELIIGALSL